MLPQTLVGHFLTNHDIRVPIPGMGREVAIFPCIPALFATITNRDDLHRPVPLEPLFDLINGQRQTTDEGCDGRGIDDGSSPKKAGDGRWIIRALTSSGGRTPA
jgi:hypothetical protein